MQENENILCHSREKFAAKEKLARFTVAALLFIACPGDDIAVLAAAASPLSGQTQVDPRPILDLFWVNNNCKQLKWEKPEIPTVEKCTDFEQECIPTPISAENIGELIAIQKFP